MLNPLEQTTERLATEISISLAEKKSYDSAVLIKTGKNDSYKMAYQKDYETKEEVLQINSAKQEYPRLTIVMLSNRLEIVVSTLAPLFHEFQETHKTPPNESYPFHSIGVELSRQIANPPAIPPKAPKKTYARCFSTKLPDLTLITKELIEYYIN